MIIEIIKLDNEHAGIVDKKCEQYEYLDCSMIACDIDTKCGNCVMESYEFDLIKRDKLDIKKVEI